MMDSAFDIALREALLDANMIEYGRYVHSEEAVEYSAGYQQEIRKLTEKVRGAGRNSGKGIAEIAFKVLKIAAVIMLVVSVSTATLTIVVPEVKAAVSRLISDYDFRVTSVDGLTVFEYEDRKSDGGAPDVEFSEPAFVPPGYEKCSDVEDAWSRSVKYSVGSCYITYKVRSMENSKSQIYVESDGIKQKKTKINGKTAYVYASAENEGLCTLIWFDADEGLCYSIEGMLGGIQELTKADLLEMAESV